MNGANGAADGHWRPTAGPHALRVRARLLARVRDFFAQRGVLEVETPLLCQAVGSDPNLEPLRAGPPDSREHLYLQTSPEFAMKRLLAAGSGPIYQVCKAFRQGEAGSRHNPEFTLLEWYRPGFDEHRLMDEVEALVKALIKATGEPLAFQRHAYRDLFATHLGLDPHAADTSELREVARHHLDLSVGVLEEGYSRDDWLDLLFSHVIEPELRGGVFIHDYPASQAALARLGQDARGQTVARRFELVLDGVEIANGYYELCDAAEQEERFERDQALRRQRGQPCHPMDGRFLAALRHGLPDCAGVALGLDRLLMRQLGVGTIADVLAFPIDRA